MKLQLDNRTLNAYINEALKQELNENNMDELFGSRVRKQSKRMITGHGWGNQRRSQDNLWGTANTDISSTDANEEVPQTLVGMIKQMENGLCTMEELAGIEPQEAPGTLANSVAQYRNGGGFKMRASLLAAINALSRIADRVSAVEKVSGSNAIMESAGDYVDAAVGGNAVAGNAINMSQLGRLQRTARSASAKQGAATRALNKAIGQPFMPPTKTNQEINQLSQNLATAKKANQDAKTAMAASNIGRNTGFWGKQIANVKNGAQMVKGAGEAGKAAAQAASAAGKGAKAAKAIGAAKTVGQVAKGIGQISQIPMLLLTIADEAARQGAQARQRKIVRTYNCASVLAKRMANIAQEIAGASGEPTEEESLMEINVRRSRKSFDSIEQGMNQLSALMKQINAKVTAAQNGTASGSDMPASLNTPEEIKQFQEWANANGYVDQNGQPLVPDGKFGPKTEYVYDQIASKLGTISESKIVIKEGQDVLSALTDLENKVGLTGSGGRAYSDISRMSGGANGSRMQGARAAKFIIRTYPPVLNQYLEVLGLAGADVRGIQPLRTDTRPNRDYDVREIQAIDQRIQQLLSIAQTVEDVKPGRSRVTLPPKPAVVSRPKPTTPAPTAPEAPELGDVQIDEPEVEVPVDDFSNLDSSVPEVQKMGYPNPKNPTEPQGEQDFVDNVINTLRKMGMDNNASIKFKKMSMSQAYQNAILAIDRMVEDGTIDNATARSEKQKLRSYYQEFKRGGRDAMFGDNWKDTFSPQQQTLSEQAFKKMVKQIIMETLNK